jgi:hypothetical protein
MLRYFVIHAASDRDWAEWIGEQLESLGHEAHIYERPAKNPKDYSWIERRLDAGDKVVCVLSPDFLDGRIGDATNWGGSSLRACQKRPEGALIFIVEPCEILAGGQLIPSCEIFGIPEPWARHRLRAFIGRVGSHQQIKQSEVCSSSGHTIGNEADRGVSPN